MSLTSMSFGSKSKKKRVTPFSFISIVVFRIDTIINEAECYTLS